MLNGVYATIIQVKVPQRFHGRVIALIALIALIAMQVRVPARFDVDVPDALRDGLVGFETLQSRARNKNRTEKETEEVRA